MATLSTARQRENVRSALNTARDTGVAQHEDRRKWYYLAALCLTTFILLLDQTIVNVSIPVIMKDFQTDIASIEWVLNGYLLALAVMLITFGRLADLYGRRLVFVGGTVSFSVASVICGLAPNLEILVAARVLQGLGAAAMLPAALSIVTVVFGKVSSERHLDAESESGCGESASPRAGETKLPGPELAEPVEFCYTSEP